MPDPVTERIEVIPAGETYEQVLEAHPRLNQEDIRVALAFAAKARADVLYPIPE
jgi:uncharacterized protein (DUF433 family)